MNNPLAQIWGIARCEFLIHWRRRGLKVMLLSYAVMQIFFFFVQFEMSGSGAEANQSTSLTAEILAAHTHAVLFGTWLIGAAFLLVMFPFIVAESLPRDRQFGVRELLDSLPIPLPVYLGGKVLGAWAAVGSAVLPVVAVASVVWRFIVGPYQVGPVLGMALIGFGVLVVLNNGLTVLAAAGQRNATRALLVGLGCVLVLPLLLLPFGTSSPVQLLSPLRLPILYYYAGGTTLPAIVWSGKSLSAETAFALTAAGGLVELAIAGVLALYTLKSGGEE